MAISAIAATKLSDLLKPKSVGEPVNVHVVEDAQEPKVDFEEMRRMIEGQQKETKTKDEKSP